MISLQSITIIGLLLSLMAAAFWFYRQGKKTEQLNTAKEVEGEQNKDLKDVQKANDFDDRARSDADYAERMRQLLNQEK